jgi:small ligand-binding sensory domain FIST
MQASSSIQQHDSIMIALGNAIHEARSAIQVDPQWILVFVSGPECEDRAEAILENLRKSCPEARIFGGIADGLIGTAKESENRTCASVLMIAGLSAPPKIFHMECAETPDGWSVFGIDDEVHRLATACGGLLTIACPQTFSAEMLYDSLESIATEGEAPVTVFGGNLSHSPWSNPATMFFDDQVVRGGAIGLIMPREVVWSTLVSQGCRPIGDPMVITEMHDNTIVSLGGKPALERLRDTFQDLATHERAMAMRLLLLGRAISEFSNSFSHGEFLIRNITGIDQEARSIHVAGRFQVGQTVRFHLLDAQAADADLRQLLAQAAKSGLTPRASMLFSCNGRGQRMFSSSHHDAATLEEYFHRLPCAGFLAAGEFGPVDRMNFVHGFTAVVAFLSERGNRELD